jgi:LAO/AO transport system kinase
MVQEHRAVMEADGGLERRRRSQLLGWMWDLVDDGLRNAVREHPDVAATLGSIKADVLEGRTTPTAAADRILHTFGLGKPPF